MMGFCSNCGNSLQEGIKFCPSCGTKRSIDPTRTPTDFKGEMKKGVTRGLKDEGLKRMKKTAPKKLAGLKDNSFADRKNFGSDEPKSSPAESENNPRNSSRGLIGFYLLINIVLLIFSRTEYDILGIFSFSVIILMGILFRSKKEKVFNWFIIFLLLVQLIYSAGIFIIKLDLVEISDVYLIQPVVLIVLFIAILLLIFRGNKTKKYDT